MKMMKHGAWSMEHGAKFFELRQTAAAFPRRSTPHAFSLAEVLIALAIASFSILMLIAVIPSGLSNVQDAQRRAAEARIVQHLAARYQMLPWEEITSISGGNQQDLRYDGNGNPLSTTASDDDTVYRARAEVLAGLPLPNEFSASPFLRRLRVRVTTKRAGGFENSDDYTERHALIANFDQVENGATLNTPVETPGTGGAGNP